MTLIYGDETHWHYMYNIYMRNGTPSRQIKYACVRMCQCGPTDRFIIIVFVIPFYLNLVYFKMFSSNTWRQ